MKKTTYLREIQKRMPDDIVIEDETDFEFTEDEYISILSWIKLFNKHYEKHGKDANPDIIFPIISKRLRLDFGLYRFPSDLEEDKGKHAVYISPNGRLMDGSFKKNITVKYLVNTWRL